MDDRYTDQHGGTIRKRNIEAEFKVKQFKQYKSIVKLVILIAIIGIPSIILLHHNQFDPSIPLPEIPVCETIDCMTQNYSFSLNEIPRNTEIYLTVKLHTDLIGIYTISTWLTTSGDLTNTQFLSNGEEITYTVGEFYKASTLELNYAVKLTGPFTMWVLLTPVDAQAVIISQPIVSIEDKTSYLTFRETYGLRYAAIIISSTLFLGYTFSYLRSMIKKYGLLLYERDASAYDQFDKQRRDQGWRLPNRWN